MTLTVPSWIVWSVLWLFAVLVLAAVLLAIVALVIAPLWVLLRRDSQPPATSSDLWIIRQRLAEHGDKVIDSKELRFRARRISWVWAKRSYAIFIGRSEDAPTQTEGA